MIDENEENFFNKSSNSINVKDFMSPRSNQNKSQNKSKHVRFEEIDIEEIRLAIERLENGDEK